MSKIKLLHFEIISLISDGKRLLDYLQKSGVSQIEEVNDECLLKIETTDITERYRKDSSMALKAVKALEKYCNIKRNFIESISDIKFIDYEEYKSLSDKSDDIRKICDEILDAESKINDINNLIAQKNKTLNFCELWSNLDIPMASRRTMSTEIFIGTFASDYKAEDIIEIINRENPDINEFTVEVTAKDKLQTGVVVIAHNSVSKSVEDILKSNGFVFTEKTVSQIPVKERETLLCEISTLNAEKESLLKKLAGMVDNYDDLRFLIDYSHTQIEKYSVIEKSAQTENVFVIRGFIPESNSEEIRFELENRFTCQMETEEPDYENTEVPVLIENKSFASGVENITDMYSSPSNRDIDPNPIMAFFYYIFFGFMLSDAGYGLLMVIFSLIAKKKFSQNKKNSKFISMVFFCGLSTVFWGVMFGGWFGDLISVVSTEFFNLESGPNIALWMDPVDNSMTLLLYCLGFGILQLFTGLIIHGYQLFKRKDFIGSVCDTVPVMIFVVGFAILGASLITEISESIMPWSTRFLFSGAVLIVLTAGRSARNIIGKLGGGLYALYNTTTGYLGDILSYSRLLALGLVTGVIANAVNLLASMPGNIILFILIFVVGHIINFAINVIGTYVHTNRLQYVEFFSKFYEGSGKSFTPFKLNSNYYIVKEEKKYD